MKPISLSMKYAFAITTIVSVSALAVGCSSSIKKTKTMQPAKAMTTKMDGDVTVPSDYRNWPKFVHTVDKNKTGQVREIYINKIGMNVNRGGAFPTGTVSIMEIYETQKSISGTPMKSPDGSLIKGNLAKVFVMEKGNGWGKKQPAGTINNGDWIYGAYLADAKTPATKDFTACRSCHLPMANKDFIARYDEHFDVYNK